MSQTFKCPNCGAPLSYEGGPDLTIECPYCKSPVIVPEELRGATRASAPGAGAHLPGTLEEIVELAGPLAEIARLVHSGRKIEAVKLYRQTFNVGLQEAKDAVDKIERGEPITMTSVTVERIAPGEPVVMTDVAVEPLAPEQERRVKRTLFATIAAIAAFQGTAFATVAAIVAILGVLFLAFYAIAILPLRHNPVYRTAMELVKNDPTVVELFGSPIHDSLFVVGTTEGALGGSEVVNLRVAIRGPRARGTAHISGEKEDGTGRIFSIWIEIGGETVLEYRGSEPERGFQVSPAATRTGLVTPTPAYASVALQFGGEGIGPGWFEDARSIAVDGAGNIYVAEYTGGRVQVFDPTGTFITQWFVGDSKTRIYSMAADRRGTVYVASGDILRVEGATGRLLGPLEYPHAHFGALALTPDGGLLAVYDHDSLVRFDAEGNVTQVLQDVVRSLTGGYESIDYLAVDGLGNVFIASSIPGLIFKFTPEGRFVDRFGSRGDAPGQFRTPIDAIAVDNQGRIYAADFDGIKAFDATGSYLGIFEVEGAVRAMVFNEQNELFAVTSVQQVAKFRLNRPDF